MRGGYGIIYTNAQHSILSGEISAFQQFSLNIRNPSYPDPYQGRDPLTFVSTAPPNISIGANNLVNAPATTYNAGFSREFGSSAVHVDGVYTRVEKLPTNIQINEADPVTKKVPLPEWGHVSQRQPIGTYDYRALMTRFENRGFLNGQYVVSYTLAKQDANQGTIVDHLNPGSSDGPADNDRRHGLSVSGSVPLRYGITLGSVWTLRSARPFNALAGRDLNADGSNTDFVPGTTRNQGNRGLDMALVNAWRAENNLQPLSADQIDGDPYNRLDVRASKAIALGAHRRVELIAQVFNVFGRTNLGAIGVTTYVTNALSDSFGRILTAQPRQQAELAVRFVW